MSVDENPIQEKESGEIQNVLTIPTLGEKFNIQNTEQFFSKMTDIKPIASALLLLQEEMKDTVENMILMPATYVHARKFQQLLNLPETCVRVISETCKDAKEDMETKIEIFKTEKRVRDLKMMEKTRKNKRRRQKL